MNMNFKRKLPIPQEIKEMYPLSEELAKIKEKNDLIDTIYSHFDENSRMIESLYNYKIVKWTLIIATLTLLATIFLANNSEILNQIIEFFEKWFK